MFKNTYVRQVYSVRREIPPDEHVYCMVHYYYYYYYYYYYDEYSHVEEKWGAARVSHERSSGCVVTPDTDLTLQYSIA